MTEVMKHFENFRFRRPVGFLLKFSTRSHIRDVEIY